MRTLRVLASIVHTHIETSARLYRDCWRL